MVIFKIFLCFSEIFSRFSANEHNQGIQLIQQRGQYIPVTDMLRRGRTSVTYGKMPQILRSSGAYKKLFIPQGEIIKIYY